jgi:hypothetical protein
MPKSDVEYPWSYNSTVQQAAGTLEMLIRRLVQFMREEGIEEYAGPVPDISGAVQVRLVSPAFWNQQVPAKAAPEYDPPLRNAPKQLELPFQPPVDTHVKVGDDGLTVEQQIDLYGRPLDSFSTK